MKKLKVVPSFRFGLSDVELIKKIDKQMYFKSKAESNDSYLVVTDSEYNVSIAFRLDIETKEQIVYEPRDVNERSLQVGVSYSDDFFIKVGSSDITKCFVNIKESSMLITDKEYNVLHHIMLMYGHDCGYALELEELGNEKC